MNLNYEEGEEVSSRDFTVRVILQVTLSYGLPSMSNTERFMGNTASEQSHLDTKSNNSNESTQNQQTQTSSLKNNF